MLADTHVVVWLLDDSPRLSVNARQAIKNEIASGRPILVSAITIAELTYLVEKRRIDHRLLDTLLQSLRDRFSGLAAVALDSEMAAATSLIDRQVVADFPDRLIAATALVLQVPLITADRKIRRAVKNHVW